MRQKQREREGDTHAQRRAAGKKPDEDERKKEKARRQKKFIIWSSVVSGFLMAVMNGLIAMFK